MSLQASGRQGSGTAWGFRGGCQARARRGPAGRRERVPRGGGESPHCWGRPWVSAAALKLRPGQDLNFLWLRPQPRFPSGSWAPPCAACHAPYKFNATKGLLSSYGPFLLFRSHAHVQRLRPRRQPSASLGRTLVPVPLISTPLTRVPATPGLTPTQAILPGLPGPISSVGPAQSSSPTQAPPNGATWFCSQ